MMKFSWLARVLPVVLLSGCAGGVFPPQPLSPSGTVQLSPTLEYPTSTMATAGLSTLTGAGWQGAVAYLVLDPLAPNWEMTETRLGQAEYQISLRMKAFKTGGDGEARLIFQRRAARLAREGGYASYKIESYSEGIESTLFPAARQVAEGVVRLVMTSSK